MGYLDEYKVDVLEGQSGAWCVERFTVTEKDEKLGRLRAAISFSSRGRYVPAGNYTRLMRNGTLVMSDTPDEIGEHLAAIYQSKGRCLVNGLGLGVVVQAMLRKPEVERVTVIEISPDVIKLVGQHYLRRFGDKLEIIEDDALIWKAPKGMRYDVVWNDIWDAICSDTLPEMHRLHRKYGRRTDWQGSWCRYLCER